ncbi:MAG TPA: penicillin-binding transpeptidase domain-containing protein, partial [Pyrinomonadaceae bacterium]|nr:penicillin-binding transpeptidase domain-containing protein [Pyrinomonadaceae bacterium]
MKAGRTEQTTLRPDASRRRALFVSALLGAWMVVIGARLVELQAFRHEELAEYGRTQQQLKAGVKASRGLILDRSGRELASSVEVESFFAVPSEVEDARATAEAFASAAGVDGARLAARLEAAKAEGPKSKGGKFVWLARKLDEERAARVRALSLKGVYTRAEYERRYPSGRLAAHVVGFVGQEEEEGLGGVELIQDAALKGGKGERVLEGDARRKSYASLGEDPRPGQSVVLTLDQTIQHYAESALERALARAPYKSATAIVLEPRTGEVLALANAPSFDPNVAKKVPDELRKNHALQDIYEPGSTFKIVAFSAAFEEKLAKPDDKIDCQMGSITVAGRVVRDHTAYGTLTMTEALAKSSNVAAIKLGLRV